MTIFDELQKIEDEVEQLALQHSASNEKAQEAFLDGLEPLCRRRYELVTGKVTPTAAEVEGFNPAASSSNISSNAPIKKGVPFFWLNVLCNEDTISEHVTSRDKLALEALEDVRLCRGPHGQVVEFLFASNAFFDNKTLRRSVQGQDAESSSNPVREELTAIRWKADKNLTVKEVARKGSSKKKKGKGEDVPERKRHRPCPSFFRFFSAGEASKAHDPTAHVDDEQDEDVEVEEDDSRSRKRQLDWEIQEAIIQKVIPKAVHLFLSGPLRAGGDDAAEDDDFQLVSGQQSGMDALPLPVQRILHALKRNQSDMDAVRAELEASQLTARKELHSRLQELFRQRLELLRGAGGDGPPVPRFWVRALRGVEGVESAVSRRDVAALRHLTALTWRTDPPTDPDPRAERTGTLELQFSANPFFRNKLLTKRYTFLPPVGGLPLVITSSSAERVDWQEGQDLTTRPGPSEGSKPRPAASFFCLFKQGCARHAFHITGDDRYSSAEAQAAESALLSDVATRLQPYALQCYALTRALDSDNHHLPSDDDDDEEEDEEEEDEEEGDGDGKAGDEGGADRVAERTARSAARQRAREAAAAARPWLSKQNVLLLLIALMVMGEVFVFIDMAGFWRGTLKS